MRSSLLLVLALVALAALSPLFARIVGAQNYTLVGEVWKDANCDGVRQPDEPALPGVNVALIGQGSDRQIFTADDRLVEQGQARTPDGQFRFTRGGPFNREGQTSSPGVKASKRPPHIADTARGR